MDSLNFIKDCKRRNIDYIKLIYCTAKLPISPTLYYSLSNKMREGLNVKGLSYQYSTRKPVQECKCKIQVLYKWKYLHCDKFCGFMIFRLKPKFHPCKNCYHQKHLGDKIAKCSPSENKKKKKLKLLDFRFTLKLHKMYIQWNLSKPIPV